MKVVYRAANTLEAEIVAGLLRSQGMAVEVMQTTVGAIAVQELVRVMVDDEHYDAALAVVNEYDKSATATVTSEENSKPHAVLGVFTKSVLFWVSLALLIFFFMFGIPTIRTGEGVLYILP